MQNLSAKYCYNVLNINPYGTSINRLERTLMQSKIKLTPHQIDAALFAFRSPYSKGAILADEVGLGKTIEAGIVISQYILERKNRILIIAPASLLRQWECELFDKFGLESIVLDRKTYNRLKRTGYPKPFSINKVILCSYQMCSIMKDEISFVGFDLVVVDEAHKLRNVHNSKSVTAQNVFYAINKYKKLLLTATPIQNSLMDLYGLSQFIDTDIFPDKKLFKNSYIKDFYIN